MRVNGYLHAGLDWGLAGALSVYPFRGSNGVWRVRVLGGGYGTDMGQKMALYENIPGRGGVMCNFKGKDRHLGRAE